MIRTCGILNFRSFVEMLLLIFKNNNFFKKIPIDQVKTEIALTALHFVRHFELSSEPAIGIEP